MNENGVKFGWFSSGVIGSGLGAVECVVFGVCSVRRKVRKRLNLLDLQFGGLLFLKLKYPKHAPQHLRVDSKHLDFQTNHVLRHNRVPTTTPTASCYCRFALLHYTTLLTLNICLLFWLLWLFAVCYLYLCQYALSLFIL